MTSAAPVAKAETAEKPAPGGAPVTASKGASGDDGTRAVFARALAEAVAEESRRSGRIDELEREIEGLRAERDEAAALAASLRAYLERPVAARA
ncbi:MAG: hypothetical protein AB7F65_06155 [Dehalococcoidia bacterium]